MEMDYLSEFAAIAKLGSFSLAAEELFISQSSLSKHIIALEKDLNVRLFDRTSRKVTLSKAGTQILPYAEQISDIKDSINNIATEESSLQKSVINIASVPVMAQYDITGALARFHKDHPFINLAISEYGSHEILKMLEAGDCELVFISSSTEGLASLDHTVFCRDSLVVVLPESHPLANEETIRLQQLKNEEFLFLDKSTMVNKLCFNLFSSSGFTPKVKYTGHRPENVIELVSQGLGIALMMKRHLDYFKITGIKCIDIKPTVEGSICLAKMKSRKISKAAKLFWNYINSLQAKQ